MDNTDSSSDERTPLTNSPEDNSKPHIELPGPIKSRRSNKIVLFVVAVVLISAGGAGYWFWHKSASKNQAKTPAQSNAVASNGVSVSPRFDSVSGYASFKGSEWYAVTGGVVKIPMGGSSVFYTEREGVPHGTPTGLTIHNDKLWLSTQDGVATLKDDGSGFVEMSVAGKISTSDQSILNGKIYNDTFANKLYLNDFKGFYSFNDSTSSWEIVPGNTGDVPTDVYHFASNKDYLVASGNNENMHIWVYNKKTSIWKLNRPATIQDATPSTFTLDDQLFVMGRTKGYGSCDAANKVVASSVYRLDASGTWQPLTEFNKDIKRLELQLGRHVKDSSTAFYTMPCNSGESTRYSVAFKDNTLVLSNPTTLSQGTTAFAGNDGEQQMLVDALTKATGLYPFTKVQAVDKQGNLIFSYTKTAGQGSYPSEDSLAIAKGTDLRSATQISVPNKKDYGILRPIMCDGSFNYLFQGMEEGSEGGPTGEWAEAKILKMDGNTASEFIDLKNDAADARFACANGKITWLGKQSIQQIDLASKQIKPLGQKIGTNFSTYSASFYPLDNGDGWALIRAVENKQDSTWLLYYIDSTKGTVEKVASNIVGSQVSVSSATISNAWIVTNGTDSNHQKLTIYDKKGTAAYSKEYISPVSAIATGSDTSILISGVSATESVFRRFTVSNLSLDGKLTPVAGEKIAIHSLYDVNDQAKILDLAHKQIWVTDAEFGLFTIPLE